MSMRIVFWILLSAGVMLGQQALYIELSGEWRQYEGDQPAFAQPDFDDQGWSTAQLPWQQRPTYKLFWLRRSVDLPAWAAGMPLALTLGPVSPVYEVYVNGMRIGDTGPFFDDTVVHPARSRTHLIPAAAVAGRSRLTVAVRARDYTFGSQTLTIFRGGSYLLTDTRSARGQRDFDVLGQQRMLYTPVMVLSVLLFAFVVLLGLLWLTNRGRTEPLWLGLLVAFRAWFDWRSFHFLTEDAAPPFAGSWQPLISEASLIELVLASVGLRPGWWRALIWGVVVALAVTLEGQQWRLATRWMDVVAILLVTWGWWRNGGLRQRPIPHLMAGTLVLLALTRLNSGGLGLFPVFVNGAGYLWSSQSSMTAAFAAILTTLLIINLGADRREGQRLASELEAARVVQQLLITGATAVQSGFAVESVYEPAQEVGGDFYQVLTASDGALLVVVGDVSGKGLKAALVVSMMAGVIRSHADLQPAALLGVMNDTVGEGSGGFVTAIVCRCGIDGELTIANAGHLNPYRNGVEIATEPGLPLGVALGLAYTETLAGVAAGETITLLTDGIVEAANPKGELFGFERTREISGKSAGEIADAAKAWGQNDDITVVTVRRSA